MFFMHLKAIDLVHLKPLSCKFLVKKIFLFIWIRMVISKFRSLIHKFSFLSNSAIAKGLPTNKGLPKLVWKF